MAARKSRAKTKAARPATVAAYLTSLTPEKRTVIEQARAFVRAHEVERVVVLLRAEAHVAQRLPVVRAGELFERDAPVNDAPIHELGRDQLGDSA